MRYAELLFLVLLVLYHVVLLVPRHKRLFPANYLVFLAGMALAWNLGLEGLRWQTLPPVVLLLLDLAVLFPTFATLRGAYPKPGFWSIVRGSLRFLVALGALLIAVTSALLSVAFPLPRVELTGGLPTSYREVRFPAEDGKPGLALQLWYPASGDTRPLPRAISEPETWQRLRASEGLPVFWMAYLDRLPTTSIVGGKLAAPQTKYPVVYVAVPRGQEASEFAYLWEDLASRGFLVVAGGALPAPLPDSPPFEWTSAGQELARPFVDPTLWLTPESRWHEVPAGVLLAATRGALQQLDAEPGDLLYRGVDWSRQGLWAWGSLSTDVDLASWKLRGVVHAGPEGQEMLPNLPELSLRAEVPPTLQAHHWVLTVPGLRRADLADAAYLKPMLAFVGLKTQADAGFHGAIRQYQAAFYQYVFWQTDASFAQTVPTVPGLTLSGR